MLRVAALVALLMVAFPLRAAAADIRQGNDIVIGANDTVDDDLYAFGNSIAINGTVNGDVVGAGQSLSVDGTVNGNVIFAGSLPRVAVRSAILRSLGLPRRDLAQCLPIMWDLIPLCVDHAHLARSYKFNALPRFDNAPLGR